MKKTIIVLVIVGCIFNWTPYSRADELEMRIIKVKHANTTDLFLAAEGLKSDDGKVTISPDGNSLIVVDYPEYLERVTSVMVKIDLPVKQVEVRVLVAEVTSAFLGRVGMHLAQKVMSPEEFDRVRYLLESGEGASIRSEMTVLTMSGKPASLGVLENEIFPQVTILHEGGVTVVPEVEISAGRSLEVLPKVNTDGTITVSLRPSVGEFTGVNTTRERRVFTSVIVESGDTVAIGGLDVVGNRRIQEGIPLTGISVPAEYADGQYGVIVFLTATVL